MKLKCVVTVSCSTFECAAYCECVYIRGDSIETTQDLWFARLVRLLHDHFNDQAKEELATLFSVPATDVAGIYQTFRALGVKPVIAMDDLDQCLERQGHHMIVTYDLLDNATDGDELDLVDASVRSLISFWVTYANRWQRLNIKLILRNDLFQRCTNADRVNLSRHAYGRVELSWQ